MCSKCSPQSWEPILHSLRYWSLSPTMVPKADLEISANKSLNTETMNRPFPRIAWSTRWTRSSLPSLIIYIMKVCTSSSKFHHQCCTLLPYMNVSPHTSLLRRWISVALRPPSWINPIATRTPPSVADSIILDMLTCSLRVQNCREEHDTIDGHTRDTAQHIYAGRSRGNVLASRSKVRGFKPGWSRWILGHKYPEHKSSGRDFKLGVPSLRFQAR